MRNRLVSSSLAVVLGASLGLACEPARGQQRPSSKISAFDAKGAEPAEAAAPAPKPAAEPAPVASAPAAHVLYGAVVPAAPRVDVAVRSSRVRTLDGRLGGSAGGFTARPATATRFAVNSPFGVRSDPLTGMLRMHTGVDLRAEYGESVGASMSGTVWFAGERSGYGNLVVVDHGSGIATFYAHLSKIVVAAGEKVDAGQLVGYVGSTGRSTGPHLHYEVRANGRPVDPSSALALDGDQLLVNGQSVGIASTAGPVALPKAPGGTSISIDFDDPQIAKAPDGQSLMVDWE